MKIKIGVIFGGASVEHEISIISALWAMSFIDLKKYEIAPIYITKDKKWYTGSYLRDSKNFSDIPALTSKCKEVILYEKNGNFILQTKSSLKKIIQTIDLAFPIVHGAGVEDGTLQGYLETIGIPYVGSSVLASATAQDKVIMKDVFNNNDLPVAPYVWFYDTEYEEDEKAILKKIEALDYPVIIKPATLGSSIGISKAKNRKELLAALHTAFEYDTKIVVEKVVPNLTEVNCSVIGNYQNYTFSALEEVMGKDEFLSYQDKYIGNSKSKGTSKRKGMANTNRIIPARITNELTAKIQAASLKACHLLGVSGIVRIDYLIDKKTNDYYINEINAIPGDLSFYLWPAKKPGQLIDELIKIAIKNQTIKKQKINSFATNILQNLNNLNGNKR